MLQLHDLFAHPSPRRVEQIISMTALEQWDFYTAIRIRALIQQRERNGVEFRNPP